MVLQCPFHHGCLVDHVTTLQRIEGAGAFALTVSDDAAIGRAIRKYHLRNVLIPHTVSIPFERLDLRGGGTHLLNGWPCCVQKAVDVSHHLAFVAPLLWSFLTFLLSLLLFGIYQAVLIPGTVLLVCALLARLGERLLLNRRVYTLPGLRSVWWLPIYELLAVPILFGKGGFQRTIRWRGSVTAWVVTDDPASERAAGRFLVAAEKQWP